MSTSILLCRSKYNTAAGTIYKLSVPFLPAPLIDKASSLGLEHWLVKEGDEAFVVYFYKGK